MRLGLVGLGTWRRHRVEHRDVPGALGPAPDPALRLDRHAPDGGELYVGLDAFDDAGDVELKGHRGDAVHDGGVGALVGQPGGEDMSTLMTSTGRVVRFAKVA